MSKALYKQKCTKCRKNMALVYSRRARPVCTECIDKELAEDVKGKLKKFFDIPKELYYKYEILRSIRSYYNKFGKITERQKEAFEKILEKESKDQDS